MPRTDSPYQEVVRALEASVERNLADGLLLSGGLDTTLIAYVAARRVKLECVTVAFSGAPAPDVEYASLVAHNLGLNHYAHYFGDDELEEAIRAVIQILKTFDPMEVRNSAAGYVALKVASGRGLKAVMTGDGADELFGGYSFLFGLAGEELEAQLRRIWAGMRFSSVPLAEYLGIQARLPFIDPEFRALAESLDAGLKVRKEGGRTWGKWVLRKAFEGLVPPELLWREKAPFEVGCGTTVLPALMAARISDGEFAKDRAKYLREDGVNVRSQEHLHYYQIYRELFGPPRAGDNGQKTCPDCGAGVREDSTFCITCGAYPV